MSALLNKSSFAEVAAILSEPSWPLRWEAAKGTAHEQTALKSIADESEHKDRELHCAAYDAWNARDADERASFIADVERIFIEYAAAEDELRGDYYPEYGFDRVMPASLGGRIF